MFKLLKNRKKKISVNMYDLYHKHFITGKTRFNNYQNNWNDNTKRRWDELKVIYKTPGGEQKLMRELYSKRSPPPVGNKPKNRREINEARATFNRMFPGQPGRF